MNSMVKGILARSHGGLGKAVAFTGFVKAVRKNHPKPFPIHVQSSWSDVFRSLPEADRHFDLQNPVPYFAEDHDSYEIMGGEPYERLPYRAGSEHLIESWCHMHGVPIPPPEEKRGFLRVLEAEHRQAVQFLAQVPRNRRWVAFQPFGGNGAPNQQVRSFSLDLAQAIVNKLVEKEYIVIQFSLPLEPPLEKTIRTDPGKDPQGNQVFFTPRMLFALLNLCDGFIGCDSFGQHAWAALGKKNAVVCWGATRPENLGYPGNVNLTVSACPSPGCNRPSVLGDVIGGNGQVWSCPHEETCMTAHNPEKIVAEFEKANGWEGGQIPAPAK